MKTKWLAAVLLLTACAVAKNSDKPKLKDDPAYQQRTAFAQKANVIANMNGWTTMQITVAGKQGDVLLITIPGERRGYIYVTMWDPESASQFENQYIEPIRDQLKAIGFNSVTLDGVDRTVTTGTRWTYELK